MDGLKLSRNENGGNQKWKQMQNESKSRCKMVSLIPWVVFTHREMKANKLKALSSKVGSTREDRLKLKT